MLLGRDSPKITAPSIESVRQQTLVSWELIGPAHSIPKGEDDARVRRTEQIWGKKFFDKHVQSPLIAFILPGDLWLPHFLQRHSYLIEARKASATLSGYFRDADGYRGLAHDWVPMGRVRDPGKTVNRPKRFRPSALMLTREQWLKIVAKNPKLLPDLRAGRGSAWLDVLPKKASLIEEPLLLRRRVERMKEQRSGGGSKARRAQLLAASLWQIPGR